MEAISPFPLTVPAPAHTTLTPAKPVSLCSNGFLSSKCLSCPSPHIPMFPSLRDMALISFCQHLAKVWHRQAFEQEVLSPFPELKFPQHFISTSLWAQSSSYLGLDSCSRLERIIILTAGARMPLRGNCLCPGKYFHELLGIDKGETPRAGLAQEKQQKRKLNALLCILKGNLGSGERNQGREVKRAVVGQCHREAELFEHQDI